MKKALLLLSLTGLFYHANAQNLTAPVGIGTTTPTSTLEVMAGATNSANGVVLNQGTSGSNVNSGRLFFSNAADITTNSFGIYKNNNALQFTYGANPSSTSGTAGISMTNIGFVGFGTTNPVTNLHIVGSGASINGGTTQHIWGGGLVIQANTGGRSDTLGAQLEFAIPATTDGVTQWGQGRIITVAGNTINNSATGKMILGTRRFTNKLGTGSQWYYGNDIVIDGTGKVGIGTTTPGTILDAVATSGGGGIRSISSATLSSSSGGGLLAITSAIPTAAGQRLGVVGYGAVTTGITYKYSVQMSAFAAEAWDTVGNGSYLALYTTPKRSASLTERMRVDDAGNVSIGTIDSKGYKLAVNGSAIATSMTVKLNANWPDYVFKNAHKLPTLHELKTYIDVNHHLPDVPTVQDIKQNGQNLGEMNKILLQKVEELTLYLIELNKTTMALKNTIDMQQKEIEQLKTKEK